MSTLIDKMLIEEDPQLTPQLKRMKLNSHSDCLTTEFSRSSYILSDPKDHLKAVFPHFSEEKLQEILDKSSKNIESAQQVIYEMKLAEKQNDKDFVNLHQTDRKRKFRDLQNSTLTLERKSENINSVFTQNQKPAGINTSITGDTGRKILSIKSPKSLFTSSSTSSTACSLSDEELENIIREVSVLSSRDEIKDYLRGKISSFIHSAPEKIQTVNQGNSEILEDSPEKIMKKKEVKQKLESLVTDNSNLKKSVVCLYRKYEESKHTSEENSQLKLQIQSLKNEINMEKSKNQTMGMLLRQYDTSTRFDIQSTKNIY